MDDAHGDASLYSLVSGGILNDGSTAFLYSWQSKDLSQWQYFGPLLTLPKNYRPSLKWSGDFGVNLDCTNFMTLELEGYERDFIITGSEGGC